MITISIDTAKELVCNRLYEAVERRWIDHKQCHAFEEFLCEFLDEGDFKDFNPMEFVDNAVINEYAAIDADEIDTCGYKKEAVVYECDIGNSYGDIYKYYIISKRI